ncbi:MAG TPA: glycosyltransferase [Chryseosolibacter sp.]|nr:glycosyltransferase [Chryseosolibacter sp.]
MVQTRVESLSQEGAEVSVEHRVDYDIIMLALPRWDGAYSSTAFSLSKALSKHARVFYVDNPFTVKSFLTQRLSSEVRKRKNALLFGRDIFSRPDPDASPDLVAVTPRVVLPVNFFGKGIAFDIVSRINDLILQECIAKIINEFQVKKYILINSFNPFYGRFFNLSPAPFLKVYQTVDDISQSEYLKKHGMWLEGEWMERSDFTIVTSSELKRRSEVTTRNVFLLPNAANTKLFRRAYEETLPRPREIANLPPGKPVICYTGNICHRIDYELLVKTATHHSDKILLMVGPFANDLYRTSGLSDFPNVVFTGKKNIDELPAYLRYVDVCIIPFLCNQLTRSIYPLKINEYLSSGKPVVSTTFSQDILSFKDVIYASDDHDAFISNIDEAIANHTDITARQRIARASQNNWEDRARQFTAIVEEFLQDNDKRRSR